MDKKQADRRPEEKAAGQGAGKYDPASPEPRRKVSQQDKQSGQPEAHPIDEQTPTPGMRGGSNDILDGERSDRESRRPIHLEDDGEGETMQPGRADAEPGLGGRPQEGHERRRPHEVEPTKREIQARSALQNQRPRTENPPGPLSSCDPQIRPVRKRVRRMRTTTPSPPPG
jgi:hypothetical protein